MSRSSRVAVLLASLPLLAFPAERWSLEAGGGVVWQVAAGDTHRDNIEMSGQRVSVIVDYGADERGHLVVNRRVIWPGLRLAPNETGDQLMLNFGEDAFPRIAINRRVSRFEALKAVRHNGVTTFSGTIGRKNQLSYERAIFPSVDGAAVFEHVVLRNETTDEVAIDVEDTRREVATTAGRGVYGDLIARSRVLGSGERTVKPGATTEFTVVISARLVSEAEPDWNPATELAKRRDRLAAFANELQLETPDPVLNTAFAFAKIRAMESIYATRGGPMHGPGGGAYYAAIWANDQGEYANPLFGMVNDLLVVASAMNSFRHFAHYMNPEFKPIPSSIIAEGVGFWNGAGDRGDMAMLAYGVTRFALVRGDRKLAEEFWPLAAWCLEYCRRHLTPEGVVASDSDELEGRYPSGKANLCTSSLYYDALVSAAMLGRDLDQPKEEIARYGAQAQAVRAAIEKQFGAEQGGFHTYRYFDGNTTLRGWVCIPLAMGIDERSEGSLAALFSPQLWTENGVLVEAGKPGYWDRETLYALRGGFMFGRTEEVLARLQAFTRFRLLGEHGPYIVEADTDKGRQLAAESALYCRVFTEGLFGIRPTGLHAFDLTPHLPAEWSALALRRIQLGGHVVDLEISRAERGLSIRLKRNDGPAREWTAASGETVHIVL